MSALSLEWDLFMYILLSVADCSVYDLDEFSLTSSRVSLGALLKHANTKQDVPCTGSRVKFASAVRLKMYQTSQYSDLTEGAQEYDSLS